jgi:uncharacterized protein YjbI with pentapeptide repeats
MKTNSISKNINYLLSLNTPDREVADINHEYFQNSLSAKHLLDKAKNIILGLLGIFGYQHRDVNNRMLAYQIVYAISNLRVMSEREIIVSDRSNHMIKIKFLDNQIVAKSMRNHEIVVIATNIPSDYLNTMTKNAESIYQTKFSTDQVLAILASGRKDLRGANLEGVNLEGVNLEEVNLEGANLKNANLQGANLQGATLHKANLQGATLHKANLKLATLQGANLSSANLQLANLYRANLRRANLKDATLEGANLKDANLEGATLHKANLKFATLQGANLQDATLTWAILKWANLQNATLHKANLEEANLEGATLHKANLRRANLVGLT